MPLIAAAGGAITITAKARASLAAQTGPTAFVTSDNRAYTIHDQQPQPQPFAERVVAIDG